MRAYISPRTRRSSSAVFVSRWTGRVASEKSGSDPDYSLEDLGAFQSAQQSRDLRLPALAALLRLLRRFRCGGLRRGGLVRRGENWIGAALRRLRPVMWGLPPWFAARRLIAHQRGDGGAARLEARDQHPLDALLNEALDRRHRLH